MKVYTYSEARQRLAELLDAARADDVVIKRRGGETFVVRRVVSTASPLDVPGVRASATMADILAAIEESRRR